MTHVPSPPGLESGDLPLLSLVLDAFPEVREVLGAIQRFSAGAKFPIDSFDHLSRALGGEDESLMFRGRPMRVAEIRRLIPAYYFPISSQEDLIAKIADLQLGGRGSLVPAAPAAPPESESTIQWQAPRGIQGPSVAPPALLADEVAALHKQSEGAGSGTGQARAGARFATGPSTTPVGPLDDALQSVVGKLKYPVHGWDQVAEALGGSDATLTVGGVSMKVADTRRFIPAYYFPIASEADLTAKLAELQSGGERARAMQPEEHALGLTIRWAPPIERPIGVAPPSVSSDELKAIADASPMAMTGAGQGRPNSPKEG